MGKSLNHEKHVLFQTEHLQLQDELRTQGMHMPLLKSSKND